jgi:Tol biopolymer transport system component
VKHLLLGAGARRCLDGGSCRRVRALVGMGGSAASMVVVVALLTAACSSTASSATSSAQITTTTGPSSWSTVDINTGSIKSIPASSATSGSFYEVSPDHSKVAYNACCGWGTPVLMAHLDGTQAHKISAAGLDGVGEQWSPNGSLLVYQQRDGSTNQLGNLFLQNLATGQRTRLTNLNQTQEWGWWFTFPSFSPDGRSILYQRPKGHPNDNNRNWDLWSAPIAGGKPTLVQRNAAWGDYSPNGRWLAYLSPITRDFTGTALWITNSHGGTPRALLRGGNLRWLRWSPDGTRIAYTDGSAIYTVDAATGTTKMVVGLGDQPEWLNNHTLIFTS